MNCWISKLIFELEGIFQIYNNYNELGGNRVASGERGNLP